MRPGQFIKHDRYLDTCLRIKSCFDYGHGYEIKAEVWNMAFVESFPLGITLRVNIAKKPEDIKEASGRLTALNEWNILVDHNIKLFRNGQWRKL